MTTATLFSSVSANQNAAGSSVPNAIVNTGSPIDRATATLTVTPATGWADATIMGGFDGKNWLGGQSVFCAPNSGGSIAETHRFAAHQYVTAVLTNVAPGCAATLTITY